MPRLVLVRHAQSVFNALGRIQGQADPPLSASGRAQAELVGARMRTARPSLVISSDLQRASDTAARVAAPHGLAVEPEVGLREVALGEWEGLTREEIAERDPAAWQQWVERPSSDIVPGGEGQQAFTDRVRTAVAAALARVEGDGTLVLVTHIGVVRICLALALGLSPDQQPWPYAVNNTSLTVMDVPVGATALDRPGGVVVVAINDDAHLAGLKA